MAQSELNNVNPENYLGYVLERIGDHPTNRIDELLSWKIATQVA